MTIPDKWLADMSVAEMYEHSSRPSRRQFLRGAAFVGAASLAPNLFLRAARAAGAPPANAHLMFGADPSKSMSISWTTPGPVDHARLSFGGVDGVGTVVAAETRTLPRNALLPSATVPTHYHHVRLANLEPGHTYGYRLLHNGGETAPVTFSTAPTGAHPFTFTAFGDQGVTDKGAAITRQIIANQPAFNLVAGDCCYANDSGSTLPIDIYDWHPAVWDQWFTQAQNSWAHTPWMPAMGNHDVEPGYGEQGYAGHHARLSFPTGGFNEVVYAFRYGNVACISLDANDVSAETPHVYSFGGQTRWLDAKLAELRRDASIDFIVVYFHHCAYSTITSHSSDGGVRRAWTPLFDKYAVDLVINGHNHAYERTTPIKNGVPTMEAPTGVTIDAAKKGTTYICAGGGGRSPNDLPKDGRGYVNNAPGGSGINLTAEKEDAPWSAKPVATNNFLRIDVTPASSGAPASMAIIAIDQNGHAFDKVTMTRGTARTTTTVAGVSETSSTSAATSSTSTSSTAPSISTSTSSRPRQPLASGDHLPGKDNNLELPLITAGVVTAGVVAFSRISQRRARLSETTPASTSSADDA